MGTFLMHDGVFTGCEVDLVCFFDHCCFRLDRGTVTTVIARLVSDMGLAFGHDGIWNI